ncbi:hypothetical protein D3C81_1192070 [compost metagenome]
MPNDAAVYEALFWRDAEFQLFVEMVRGKPLPMLNDFAEMLARALVLAHPPRNLDLKVVGFIVKICFMHLATPSIDGRIARPTVYPI